MDRAWGKLLFHHEVLWTASHITHQIHPTPYPSSLHTEPNDPQRMQSALPSTQPSPTRTKKTHVRMLFIDFSSEFNTIIPQWLICKLDKLGLSTLCSWLLDFLSQRPQRVRVCNNSSSSITLSTGDPQGCVLSPLLFTLDTQLYSILQHQPHSEVCGRHISGGSHHQGWQDSLQEGGPTECQQDHKTTPTECQQDQGDCCWLPERPHPTPATDRWCCCGDIEEHHFPGDTHR